MADSQVQNQGKVFISYSRKDKEFVRKLYDGLESSGIDSWVDWEGIPLSSDWMNEITAAISGSDALLFVISPDSLNSKVCMQELEQGLQWNKKLVPVLYREPNHDGPLPEKIAATNWVYLRDQDDFTATLPALVDAIRTDLDWVKMHTRLLQRAVEWDAKQRNPSFLLRGTDLDEAESWMTQAGSKTERQVTSLHSEYILASRKDALRRQRMLLVAVSSALVVTLFLAVFALFQRSLAQSNEQLANDNAGTAVYNQGLAINNAATADSNAILARNFAATADANAVLAADNAATAVANENLAKENEQLAIRNEAETRRQEKIVRAQRIAAEAQSLQRRQPESLHLSLLLAIEAFKRDQSYEAEQVLRENLMLIPKMVFLRHQGLDIHDITYSLDGQRLLVASEDGTARVWDALSGTELLNLQHEGAVYAANFGNDEKFILTASADGSARIWDAQTGEELNRFEHPAAVKDVDMGPDVRWLASASEDGRIRVWVVAEDRMIIQMEHKGPVNDIEYRPDGKTIASAGADGLAYVWSNLSGGNFLTVQHRAGVVSVDYSPDGRFLLSASKDGSAKVMNADNDTPVFTIYHDDWVEDAVFSPDGTLVATASDDYTVRLWSMVTLKEVVRIRHDDFVNYVAFSPDNKWLATASKDGTVRLWSASSGQLAAVIPLESPASKISFSPDGSFLATSTRSGVFMVWDLGTLVNYLYEGLQAEQLQMAVFSPDGSRLAVANDEPAVRIFRTDWMREGRRKPYTDQVLFLSDFPLSVSYSQDGSKLAVAAGTDGFYIWDPVAASSDRVETGSPVMTASFNPTGTLAASGHLDGAVLVWDLTGGISSTLATLPAEVTSLAFSPDGSILAAGSADGDIHLWQTENGTPLVTLRAGSRILKLAFSPDGSWLASGNFGVGATLWELAQALEDGDGALPQVRLEHEDSVNDLAFSQDGTRMFTASGDHYLRVWSIADGDELARLAHDLTVLSVSLSPDGLGVMTTSGKLLAEWALEDIRLVSRSDLIDEACERVSRNFTLEEWRLLVGDADYEKTCENLP